MYQEKEIALLVRIGFSPSEAKIYSLLLRYGSAVVGTLAKEASMPRSTAYQILESLEKRGYVFKIDKNGVLTYYPEDPARILSELEREREAIEAREELTRNVLPFLSGLKNTTKTPPKVLSFEGVESYIELLERSLSAKNTMLSMVTNSRSGKIHA